MLRDESSGVLKQRYLAVEIQSFNRSGDFLLDRVGVLAGHDAHVDKNIAEGIRTTDLLAATNLDNLRLGNDRAAGKFKGLAFFVGDGPFFDGANYRRGFDKGIGIFLDGISPLQTRRINFSPLHPNLEPSPPHSA